MYRSKTLFSTHYHELTSLDQSLEKLKNVHVEVEEENGEVVFLHHIKEGKADKSYGIHVAKIAITNRNNPTCVSITNSFNNHQIIVKMR